MCLAVDLLLSCFMIYGVSAQFFDPSTTPPMTFPNGGDYPFKFLSVFKCVCSLCAAQCFLRSALLELI